MAVSLPAFLLRRQKEKDATGRAKETHILKKDRCKRATRLEAIASSSKKLLVKGKEKKLIVTRS